MNILQEYIIVKEKIKAYKIREEELKILLKNKINKSNNLYKEGDYNVRCQTYVRKGALDENKLLADDINLNNYRKDSVIVNTFKIERVIE